MKLTFLGTRGEIDARTDRHHRHTATLVEYEGRRVLIDCGEDWRGRFEAYSPHAIVLTHAHPDHAFGLQDGSPCPVWATPTTWQDIDDYPVDADQRQTVEPEQPAKVEGMAFTAYTVEHSTRCPAVCYRVTAGEVTVTYCPDVVYIHDRAAAMQGAQLYIGDGATPDRDLVRRRDDRLIGHTAMRTQLTWCQKENVPEAIFTHCGSPIVAHDERTVNEKLQAWAEERRVTASIAHDGLERVFR